MTTITASIERSLQNCSLNQTNRSRVRSGGSVAVGKSSSSDSSDHHNHNPNHSCNSCYNNHDSVTHESNASSSDDNSTFVELNSHVSLPYHWEQCLDLKTGEIYYINWSNGMKAKEDPRTTATGYNGDYYSEEEEEDDNEYDSEGSSTESSPPSWRNFRSAKKLVGGSGRYHYHQQQDQELKQDSVLVVAGCKSCFMYYMVPKQGMECPKCCGQLFHFPASDPPSP